MKSLYARLAETWDILFPPDTDREAFILDHLDRAAVSCWVVDVGCGTGATAKALASSGHTVLGTDLDSGMIDIAGRNRVIGADFLMEDMLKTAESLEPGSLHALLCLGNTLPHLDNLDSVSRFFSLSARGLKVGGFLLIQILDYRRIISIGSVVMPELISGNLVFRRRQDWNEKESRVEFSTEVTDGEQRESRCHMMLPLTTDELELIGGSAGLQLEEIGGSWSGTKDSSESGWLYMLFRKGD